MRLLNLQINLTIHKWDDKFINFHKFHTFKTNYLYIENKLDIIHIQERMYGILNIYDLSYDILYYPLLKSNNINIDPKEFIFSSKDLVKDFLYRINKIYNDHKNIKKDDVIPIIFYNDLNGDYNRQLSSLDINKAKSFVNNE